MNPFPRKDFHDLLIGAHEAPAELGRVPDFAFSPLNRSGELYTPIIDKAWHKEHRGPVWPEGKTFAVCLTHDVDAVSETNVRQNLHSIMHQISTRADHDLGETLKWLLIHNLRLLKGLIGKEDSLCKFEDWMRIEEKVGARSTFFFAPDSVQRKHPSDCQYRYDQKIPYEGKFRLLSDLMLEMDQGGWEVGLHPSWHSHADLDEMKRQKAQLESVLDHDIKSVRQHFLKYDPWMTPQIHEQAGFLYDSTLGFNDNIGFRRGTSFPFQGYDMQSKSELKLLEIPLAMQDGALLLGEKGLRLDPKTALTYLRELMKTVKAVGGVLNLSWHPHTRHYPGFWELYEQTLNMLAEEDPYFGTLSQIGEWWQNSVDINLIEFTRGLS